MSSFLKTKIFFHSLKKGVFPENFPSRQQWKKITKILTEKEKKTLIVFLILFFGSGLFLILNFYFQNTEIKPTFGGNHHEGVIGYPRFINPIYGEVSDADRDLIQLIFSGLLKYDEKGNVVPDLAKNYKISEEGKTFEIYLKENLLWSDGQKLTADDIIFTIETIQNPDYKSPLRADWLGVDVEKISEEVLRFKLKKPYAGFLENLTVKILPRHIWQEISSQNFPLSNYNLEAVGSGPYRIKDFYQEPSGYVQALTLTVNPKYYNNKPHLSEITFHFFADEEQLIKSGRKKEIQGFSIVSPKNYQFFKKNSFQTYYLSLPRYFAVFFNSARSKVLAEKEVRLALNYGTDKQEIVNRALLGQGKIVNSPILPEIYGFSSPSQNYNFDLNKAKTLVEKAGFNAEDGVREKIVKEENSFQFKSELKQGSRGEEVKKLQECLSKDPAIFSADKINGNFGTDTKAAVIKFQEKYAKEILEPQGITQGTGTVKGATRDKLNELCGKTSRETLPLSFTLTTVDQPALIEIADLLKEQWQKFGVDLKVQTLDIQTLEKDIIKPRNYESLLFGEVLETIPDLYPFWHSNQKKDPGLNLADYENKKADKLLEEARQSLNQDLRRQNLEKFQDILIEGAPAVFLYTPDYLYLVSKEVKGVVAEITADPSKRFVGIENWYIKTKRIWK